jgi:hypothetical protein
LQSLLSRDLHADHLLVTAPEGLLGLPYCGQLLTSTCKVYCTEVAFHLARQLQKEMEAAGKLLDDVEAAGKLPDEAQRTEARLDIVKEYFGAVQVGSIQVGRARRPLC